MRNAGMTRARQLITLAMFLLLLPAGLQAQADEEAWKRHMEAASAALRVDKPDDVLFALGSALREAEKFGPGDQRLANTLNLMASFQRSQGNVEEAESLYSRLITVLERGMGSDNPSVANALDCSERPSPPSPEWPSSGTRVTRPSASNGKTPRLPLRPWRSYSSPWRCAGPETLTLRSGRSPRDAPTR